MKKLRWILALLIGLLLGKFCFATTALIQLGDDGRPLALPIPSQEPAASTAPVNVSIIPTASTPTATTALQTGTLPNVWPNGYIYYTLPGGINFVTPWSAAILAEGYDVIGREEITQGYVPLLQWWKITAIAGGGINARGEGSPMGGGLVDLAQVPISNNVDFHIALTGGYNINERHALAVLSGSVQFLK